MQLLICTHGNNQKFNPKCFWAKVPCGRVLLFYRSHNSVRPLSNYIQLSSFIECFIKQRTARETKARRMLGLGHQREMCELCPVHGAWRFARQTLWRNAVPESENTAHRLPAPWWWGVRPGRGPRWRDMRRVPCPPPRRSEPEGARTKKQNKKHTLMITCKSLSVVNLRCCDPDLTTPWAWLGVGWAEVLTVRYDNQKQKCHHFLFIFF